MNEGLAFIEGPDCGCDCHTSPGVMHIVACCSAPPATEDSVQHCGCLCHTTPGVMHIMACCNFPPYRGEEAEAGSCSIFGDC